jgi:DUF4097 and DUF4098 domain-containing protein YvlB
MFSWPRYYEGGGVFMSEETKMILEMLREGRITADEAANLLEALRTPATARPAVRDGNLRESDRRARLDAREAAREAKAKLREDLRVARLEAREAVREAKAQLKDELREMRIHQSDDADDYEDDDELDAEEDEDEGEDEDEETHTSGLERLGALFGLGGVAYSWDEKREGDLPNSQVVKVVIRGVNGRIQVEPLAQRSPKWELRVEKSVRAASRALAEAASQDLYTVQTTDQSLIIEAKKVFGQTQTVHFRLLLPPDRVYDLDLGSTNGSVEIGSLNLGQAKATTTNGKVFLQAQARELLLGSTNGRIEVAGCASDVQCRTVNGRIAMVCPIPEEGNMRLSTVNGSISVRVGAREGLGLRFRGDTVAGSVTSTLQRQEIVSDERRRVGRKLVVQRGATSGPVLSIHANTVHGSITLEEA